ncbi:MAG: purine-nucleoside phosphorylase [Rhizobiaceae bacterium]
MRKATAELVRRLDGLMPETALVLGSGLGGLVSLLQMPVHIPYGDLDGFPQGGVSGHAGELVAGYLNASPVLVLSGRVHYYEKGNPAAMRHPLEVLKAVGIKRLVLTNSAGSLRQDMPPGSVMMITDHINWSGLNPLIGEESDARFVGMTSAYDQAMQTRFRSAAAQQEIELHEGVYMWFSGPSFETPAEIRAARMLGADAVGMSTVPEIILARFLGLDCAAFSVITNYGAGMTGDELSHGETKEVAPTGGRVLSKLIAATLGDA